MAIPSIWSNVSKLFMVSWIRIITAGSDVSLNLGQSYLLLIPFSILEVYWHYLTVLSVSRVTPLWNSQIKAGVSKIKKKEKKKETARARWILKSVWWKIHTPSLQDILQRSSCEKQCGGLDVNFLGSRTLMNIFVKCCSHMPTDKIGLQMYLSLK